MRWVDYGWKRVDYVKPAFRNGPCHLWLLMAFNNLSTWYFAASEKKIIERTKTQNVEQITISLSIRISRYRADLFENVVAGKNCVLLQAAPVRLVDWMTAEMEVISFRFVYNAYKAAYNFLGLPICRQRLSLATEIWDKFRIEHAKNHFFSCFC